MIYKTIVISLLMLIVAAVGGAFITIEQAVVDMKSTQDAIYKEISVLNNEISGMRTFEELSKAIIDTLKAK